MKITDMLTSKYLRQQDVDGEVLVTVTGLKKVNVARDDEDPEYRWTIKFAEFEKPMVMNTTNIKRAAKALGDDTDDWIGQHLILFVDENVEYAGNVVGGLRVRAAKNPAARARKVAGESVDEINRKFQDAVDDSSVPF